ncbi:hypothetical protein SAMN05216249_12423 [Acetitomaculum ruminis DSM 5522]|uniref:Uncharacterized protein n=1 Tax=Acetitomaculum ruminis DSM 5522 TaxID=1120918 RepID=A0A1I1ABM8_9FIRM|nr:hypothetical protein [Acetitomaculum ruminis]SFB35367.1 hypothetical protein SAMN05216249_12423 [Acetitomaculum ruminis DSM 5522]
MGMKLCNMNIYNPDKKEYKVPAGYSIYNIADGWDTILEDEAEFDFDAMAKIGKKLSKELALPVVTVMYFDDDIFELYVTKEGKKVAYHDVRIGNHFTKKIAVLVETLRLDEKDAKAFRYILKSDLDPEESIFKLSAICQLPFYIDSFIYQHSNGNIIPDKEEVLEEIKKEKKRNKITATKPELLEEFPGDVVEYYTSKSKSDDYPGIIRTVEPLKDGIDYGKVNCYQVAEGNNPYLRKVYEYYIPISKLTGQPKDTNICIYQFREDQLDFMEPPCMCYYSTNDLEEIKKIGDLGIIPEERLKRLPFDFNNLDTVSVKDFPQEPNFELEKESESCENTHFFTLPRNLEINEGFILRVSEYTQYKKQDICKFLRFDFWNENKEYLRTVLIPVDFNYYFTFAEAEYTYLPERDVVVYGEYIFDLKNLTITQNDKLPKTSSFIRKRIVNGKKLLIIGTSRYIHIYDYNFKRLRSYSVTGCYIDFFFDDKDNMYVITSSILHGANDRGMIAKDRVRLYKLALADI